MGNTRHQPILAQDFMRTQSLLRMPCIFIAGRCCSYAYPGVWDGQFSGCSWKQGECITPMEGDDCWVYTCTGSQVYCPSSCEHRGAR